MFANEATLQNAASRNCNTNAREPGDSELSAPTARLETVTIIATDSEWLCQPVAEASNRVDGSNNQYLTHCFNTRNEFDRVAVDHSDFS